MMDGVWLVVLAAALVVCNVNVHGRVIRERIEAFVEVSFDSQPIEKHPISELSANIFDDLLDTEVANANQKAATKECEPGRCSLCSSYYTELCANVSALDSGGYHVGIESGGRPLISTDVTGSGPVKECTKKIPRITNFCLSVTNVSISKLSGCISLSVQYKGKTYPIDVGCFQIPKSGIKTDNDVIAVNDVETDDHVSTHFHVESDNDVDVDSDVIAVNDVDTDDHDSTDDDIKADSDVKIGNGVMKRVDANSGTVTVDEVEVGKEACKNIPSYQIQVCAVPMRIPGGGMRVFLEAQAMTLMAVDIKDNKPNTTCKDTIPELPVVTDVCLSFYDVSIEKLHGCAKVTAKFAGQDVNLDLGCFDVPPHGQIRKTVNGLDSDTNAKPNNDIKFNNEVKADNYLMKVLHAGAGSGIVVKGVEEAKVCHIVYNYKACAVAKRISGGMHVDLEVDGTKILGKDIKDDTPKPECIPSFLVFDDVCLSFINVSLKTLHGCVNVSGKYNGRVESALIGCFDIEYEDIRITDDESNSDGDIKADNDVEFNNEGNAGNNLMQVMGTGADSGAVVDGVEEAKACKTKHGYTVCAVAKRISDGMHVDLQVNGQTLFGADIKDDTPKAECKPNIPEVPLTNICLSFYDVSLKTLHGCANVSAKYYGHEVALDLGCFDVKYGDTPWLMIHQTRPVQRQPFRDVIEMSQPSLDADAVTDVKCVPGKCTICQDVGKKLCAVAMQINEGFNLSLLLGNTSILNTDVKSFYPSKKCIKTISLPDVTNACLIIHVFDWNSALLLATYEYQGEFRTFFIGQFTIPPSTETQHPQLDFIRNINLG